MPETKTTLCVIAKLYIIKRTRARNAHARAKLHHAGTNAGALAPFPKTLLHIIIKRLPALPNREKIYNKVA